MKRFIRLAVLSATLSGAFSMSASATPPPLWQGQMFLVSLNQTCLNAGLQVGYQYFALMRLKFAPADPPSAIIFSFDFQERIGVVPGGALNLPHSGSFNVTSINNNGTGPASFTETYVFAVTPAAIISTTPFVLISGQITNYGGTVGCVAGVRIALNRKP